MNPLDILIVLISILSALLPVLAAYKLARAETKFLLNSRPFSLSSDNSQKNGNFDIIFDPDVIKTIRTVREVVSFLNNELDQSSDSSKWYLPLLDKEFKTALASTISKCLQMPENELSKQVIETLYVSNSGFLRAARHLDLNIDVQNTIAEYINICSIAKYRIAICSGCVKSDSVIDNVSTYNRDDNFTNKQIIDKNILVG